MPGAEFTASESRINIKGYREVIRALKRSDDDLYPKLRRELLDIAGDVRTTARVYVQHKTGRHGGRGVPRLAPTIRANVTSYGASVSSDAPHSIVQDVGGRVGHGAIIKRADASHYMSMAVHDALPYVSRRLDALMDELEARFEA